MRQIQETYLFVQQFFASGHKKTKNTYAALT